VPVGSEKRGAARQTLETREYPLPNEYVGREVALIETPGPDGRKNGVKRGVVAILKVRCRALASL
jgi:hypothetical protein